MNPYQYAYNNPLRYVDPSGKIAFDPAGLAISTGFGALAGIAFNIDTQLRENGGNWNCIDLGRVGKAALVGAVGGALTYFIVITSATLMIIGGSAIIPLLFTIACELILNELTYAALLKVDGKFDTYEPSAERIAGSIMFSAIGFNGAPSSLKRSLGAAVIDGTDSALLNKAIGNSDAVRTLYHATNEQSAKSIIDHGIDLAKTKLFKDFNPSGKRGFYLTESLEQAQKWALRKFPNSPAIVQFDVPVNKLDELSGKVFTSGKVDWLEFVLEGRNNILQHKFDYVEGPYLKLGAGQPLGHQLGIFTDEAVNLFDECVKRIFW